MVEEDVLSMLLELNLQLSDLQEKATALIRGVEEGCNGYTQVGLGNAQDLRLGLHHQKARRNPNLMCPLKG